MAILRSRSHYGVTDWQKFDTAVRMLRESLWAPDDWHYIGDNLITFGKAVAFLGEQKFTDAINAEKPDRVEFAIMWRTHILCWAAKRALGFPGDFVEAGCYRGYSAKVIANYVDFAGLDRTYWLYDLFAPNPDREQQLADQGPEMANAVRQRFAAFPNVKVIEGAVPGSFAKGAPEKIALLHIDMNSPAAEVGTLEAFWDRISPGGAVILDDYGWSAFIDQAVAIREWAAPRNIPIAELPSGQGLIIK